MLEVVLAIPFWLEFVATLTGGVFGAVSAVRARYDIFGVICIAIITGLAGGIMRDLMLQNYGIYALQRPSLLVACIIAGVVVFFFSKATTYLDPVVDLLDNVSLALWSVIGVGKATSAGLDIVPCVILGTISAIGGGILRDICMNREPEAFQAGLLYGSAACIGCIIYAVMHQNHILDNYAAFVCVALILCLRYASLFFGLRTREPRDFSSSLANAVSSPVKKVARRVRAPKGKTARDREKRSFYEGLRKLWRTPGRTSPLPPLASFGANNQTESANDADDKTTAQAADTTAPLFPSDPSDRIIINREELHQIMGANNQSEELDPFEPHS